jgi:squalene synthase HpnC
MTAPPRLDRRSGGEAAPAIETDEIMGKAAAENFSVASWLLPRAQREDLLALYGYARLVDDIGDLAPGDRLAQLDWANEELDRCFDGRATHPVFVRLAKTAKARSFDRAPLADLIAANRQDQVVNRYPNFDALAQYCALSANPVGRLVLAIFGRTDDVARRLSDAICTGLQLVEHLQDVAEDYRADRIYLPREDLDRFGVGESDLGEPSATPALRRVLAFEVGRARGLIESGAGLIGLLSGAPRFAVAGFVGGGLAQLDAIERARYDVLAHQIKASKVSVLTKTVTHLFARGSRL